MARWRLRGVPRSRISSSRGHSEPSSRLRRSSSASTWAASIWWCRSSRRRRSRRLAAHRALGAQRGRRVQGRALAQVSRRSTGLRRRHIGHGTGRGRGHGVPQKSTRCAGSTDRRHTRDGAAPRRHLVCLGSVGGTIRGADPFDVRRRARHAERSLPGRGFRGTPAAHRVEPGQRHAARARRGAPHRGGQRRHHSGPWPVRRLPGRGRARRARRRARRGDGLRVAARRRISARGKLVAHRRNHE